MSLSPASSTPSSSGSPLSPYARLLLAPLPLPSALPCSPRSPSLGSPAAAAELTVEARSSLLSILSLPWVQSLLPPPSPSFNAAPWSDEQLLALWCSCHGVLDVLLFQLTRMRAGQVRCDSFDSLVHALHSTGRRLPSLSINELSPGSPPHQRTGSLLPPDFVLPAAPARLVPQRLSALQGNGSNTPDMSFTPPHHDSPKCLSPPSLSSSPAPRDVAQLQTASQRHRARSEAPPGRPSAENMEALQRAVHAINSAARPIIDLPFPLTPAHLLPLLAVAPPSTLLTVVTSVTSPPSSPPSRLSLSSSFPLTSLSSLLSFLHRRLLRSRLLSLLSFPTCRLFSLSSSPIHIKGRHLDCLLALGYDDVEAEVRRMESRAERFNSIQEFIERIKAAMQGRVIAEEEESSNEEARARIMERRSTVC